MKVLIFLSIFVHFINCNIIGLEDHKEVIRKIIKSKAELSEFCVDDLKNYFETKSKIFEAFSNFRTDYKYGNSHNFGNFSNYKNIDEYEISTQYCQVQYFNDINPPIPVMPKTSLYRLEWTDLHVSFSNGICLPSSCTSEDVKKILEISFEGGNLRLGPKILCRTKINEKLGWNFGRILLCCSILIVSAIFLRSKIPKLQISSILKDLSELQPRNQKTAYLSGIKAVMSILIISIHTWFFRAFLPFKSGENLQNFQTNFLVIPLLCANLFMECFFIIGGVLTGKALKKGFGSSNKTTWIIKFYIKRFMRLYPVLFLIMGFIITSNTENFGPFSSANEKENCKKFWWTAFAFNFTGPFKRFAVYSWFMSIYLQLALISPFVFMAINSRKFSKILTTAVIVGITYIRFIRGSVIYPRLIEVSKDGLTYDYELMYEYTVLGLRLFPFYGGMILERTLNGNGINLMVELKRRSKTFTSASIILTILLLFSSIPQITATLDIIAVLFLMLALNFLHFDIGRVKRFLSQKFWTPISKMGLSIYLISGYIQNNLRTYQMEPLEVESFAHFISMYLGDIFQSVVPVLLTYVLIEESFARFGEIIAEKI